MGGSKGKFRGGEDEVWRGGGSSLGKKQDGIGKHSLTLPWERSQYTFIVTLHFVLAIITLQISIQAESCTQNFCV